jgi:hypothetical protein
LAQTPYINILQAKQSDASTQFYDANHLYLMKIAIIKNSQEKSSPTSNHTSPITKRTYQIKIPQLVPNFAAR